MRAPVCVKVTNLPVGCLATTVILSGLQCADPAKDLPRPSGALREDPEQVPRRLSFRDELGIEVTLGRAAVPVMVIDSVHPPKPN